MRGAVLDEENLRDADDLDRLIGQRGLGEPAAARAHPRRAAAPAGVRAGGAVDRQRGRRRGGPPTEVPNQYQLITVRPDGFTRYARQYALGQKRWIGDTRISPSGSDWRDDQAHPLADVQTTFPPEVSRPEAEADRRPAEARWQARCRRGVTSQRQARQVARHQAGQGRFSRSGRAGHPGAIPDASRPLRPGERLPARVQSAAGRRGAEQWPVGAANGPLTDDALGAFLQQVHARFASADPSVRSEFVYGGPPAPDDLVSLARQAGGPAPQFRRLPGPA